MWKREREHRKKEKERKKYRIVERMRTKINREREITSKRIKKIMENIR